MELDLCPRSKAPGFARSACHVLLERQLMLADDLGHNFTPLSSQLITNLPDGTTSVLCS